MLLLMGQKELGLIYFMKFFGFEYCSTFFCI